MPIAQDRMLRLISAAREYEQLFQHLANGAQALCGQKLREEVHAEKLFDLIQSLRPSPQAIECITAEAVHFKHARRKNELGKARLRRKREGYVMGERNKLSPENAEALRAGAGAQAPLSMKPESMTLARMAFVGGMTSGSDGNILQQRYAPPTKAELEQASHAEFVKRSEEMRRALREGTFGKEDGDEAESETEEDPEGYAGDTEGEIF